MTSNLISQCEKEQLHLSGHIQVHGGLLVLDKNLKVSHFSENLADEYAINTSMLLRQFPPQELLDIATEHAAEPGDHQYHQLMLKADLPVELIVCKAPDNSLLLEFFHLADSHPQRIDIPKLPVTIESEEQLHDYQSQLLQWIAEITDHERCMYYQFMDDGDGTVTGEVCQPDTQGTYLDLRFPASDIPQIARTLYLKNPWRTIPDAQADSIALVGAETTPDLTYSDLRSVSPVHKVYMSNMGVGSSISFPIQRNGELDALISCHSANAKQHRREDLIRIASVIAHFTTLLKDYDLRMRLQTIDEFNFKHERLRQLLISPTDLSERWPDMAQEICRNFAADGAVLCLPEYSLTFGLAPNLEALTAIDHWFANQPGELIAYTSNLSGLIPEMPLCDIAGMCAIRFRSKESVKTNLTLYLLREEHIHEVKWGGNPNKPTEFHDGQYGIAPRESFAKWVEKRLGHSQPWPSMIRLQLLRLRGMLEQGERY